MGGITIACLIMLSGLACFTVGFYIGVSFEEENN